MFISQKCQYALRAIFELAKFYGLGPVKIAEIAKMEAIPQRFLEVILSQLKQGGFVDSQRGNEGGYFLIRSPGELTVGEVIQFVQGPLGPVDCVMSDSKVNNKRCSLYNNCVFLPMWERIRSAVLDVYEHTTFQNLIDQHIRKSEQDKENSPPLCSLELSFNHQSSVKIDEDK